MRLWGVLGTVAALAAGAAHGAPLEAYGKLPNIEQATISPDGKQLALVVTNGEDRNIVLRDVETGTVSRRLLTGSAKVRSVQWAGDQHLLIIKSVTHAPMFLLNARREWTMGFSYDLAKDKLKPLLDGVPQSMNTLAGMPVVREVDGKPTVFVEGTYFVDNRGRVALFKVDLGRTTTKLQEEGFKDTIDWVVGPDGEPVAQELYDGRTGRWSLKVRKGPSWPDVAIADAPHDPPSMLGLSRDGSSVVYTRRDDAGRLVWREVALDGAERPAVAAAEEQSPIFDRYDGRLIGHYALRGDEGRYTFFDPQDDRIWRAIEKAYPGQIVTLQSWSVDRSRVIILVDSPTEGPAYALVDLKTKKAQWLGAEYAGIFEADVAPKRAIRFKAADGLPLSGYLTTPRAAPAKNLPLVVLAHGGPASRDTPAFDWWSQALASRGYAVLQVNFRGSDGLGDGLLTAGYGQWGRKMQTDLSDGVAHLVAEGVVDPKRVCIAGASYGGYAALAGATLQKGIYRCAVSVAGVTDLKRLITYSRSRGGAYTQRYWTRFMGAEDLGDPVLRTFSPLHRAAEAEVPILLVHGRDDTVVPLEQSRLMAESLQKAGKPVELIVQPGEDHWLSMGVTRIGMLNAMVTFLEKHNPAGSPAK